MIEFKNITKDFFGNVVLKNINFSCNDGEILAVLGQNGAGKSTLMKILAGVYQRSGGEILIDGEPVHYKSVSESEKAGIGVVFQELSLMPDLSVSDNVAIGSEFESSFFLNKKAQDVKVASVFESLGFQIDLQKPLRLYPASTQQLVEIAKVIYRDPKIVVLDEPTTSLTIEERKKLFEVMGEMRARGLTIIFITHYLDDALSIADKCVVLRDGEVAFNGSTKGLTEAELVGHMVGKQIANYYPEIQSYKQEKIALEVKGLCGGVVKPCDFSLHYGEVLGIAGLVGAGRTELMHLIFGAAKKEGGQIMIDGKEAKINNPCDAFKQGIAYISEDRRVNGLNLTMPIQFNIALPSIVANKDIYVGKIGMVKRDAEKKYAEEMRTKLEIKCLSVGQKVSGLSGGNQQKVSIAKWMVATPRVYIFDEPTKGIDVITKTRVFELMRELAKDGAAVIMISSYIDEVLGTCDRTLVMNGGKIVNEFSAGVSEQTVVLAMEQN